MKLNLAHIISIISNPLVLFVPVPYLLVYHYSNDRLSAFSWTLISFVFLSFVGAFVLYQVEKGKFSDLDVSRREQRPRLFFAVGIAGVIYLLTLTVLNGPPVLYIATIGIMLSIFFVSVINTKIKASIHMATITAMILIGYRYGMHPIFFLS